jgi:Baseplate J-like protein
VRPETVHLVERPYAEVVDDVLTTLLGGVVNEAIEYDLKAAAYPLSRRAAAVRSVTGTVLEADPATGDLLPRRVQFLPEKDWTFAPGANEVVWLDDGVRPADETLFYVDYLPPGARPPLTDVNVGSVTRTLTEAVSREITGLYEQVNEAYRAGFVDTARGKSLDLVVSILGVERKTAEYAAGIVSFYRDPAAGDGDVGILEGVGLRTDDGKAFVTTELRVLQRGQGRIDVPVRADGAARGAEGVVPAGAITTLVRPLLGIARIANTEPTALGAAPETDEQLRARARAAIRSLGSATAAALVRAVEEERAVLGEMWDPHSQVARVPPGAVTLLVEAEPERFAQVADAVHRTRAAGVLATVTARYVYLRPRLSITLLPASTPPEGQVKIIAQVLAAMQAYVDTLTRGQDVLGKELLAAVKTVKEAKDPVFADVVAWKSDVERAGPEAVAARTVAALSTDLPSREVLQAALAAALEDTLPGAPTGARTPARSLVLNEAGTSPATPDEIAKGEFRVSAKADGEEWWIYLDVSAADVQVSKG